jgi:hypothetical protein
MSTTEQYKLAKLVKRFVDVIWYSLIFAAIAWHTVRPLLQYFGGRVVLNDVAFNVQGIQLYPAFEFNIAGLFAGLAIIVLSGIMREAASIHHDQSLTI